MDPVNAFITFAIPGAMIGSIAWRFLKKRMNISNFKELIESAIGSIVYEDDNNEIDSSDNSYNQIPTSSESDNKISIAMNASQLTIKTVNELCSYTDWPINQVTPECIPLMANNHEWSYLSLHASEHVVVCGASRSGKGYLLQLAGLSALTLGPEEAQVWFLDAKHGLDYSFATSLVHARLYADINRSDGSLTDGFNAAIKEMERRNDLLFGKARNIHEYISKTGDKLPIILLIVDEAAELDRNQSEKLKTLARMSAASGFILMTSTQYPTVDVLSSQIQANALIRICLKLPSGKYTPVALSLAPGEQSTYDPASISPRGVAIYRYAGKEMIGRIPEVKDDDRDKIINHMARLWPRVTASQRGVTRHDGLLNGLLQSVSPELQVMQPKVTASEREVTNPVTVTKVTSATTIDPNEIAMIALQLAKGVTPSTIAKSLPSYNPRRYDESKAKVDLVKDMLKGDLL